MGGAVLLQNDHLIVNRVRIDPDGVGYPLQEIDRQGKELTLFGPQESYRVGGTFGLARLLAARRNGQLVAVKPYEYVVELYASNLALAESFARSANWFKSLPAGKSPSGGRGDEPPSTIVKGAWEDTTGMLWTATVVPAPGWKPGPNLAAWRRGAPLKPAGEGINTMIEVIDLATGRLVTSARVNPYIVHSLSNGYVASYKEDSDGTPLIDVWRLFLVR